MLGMEPAAGSAEVKKRYMRLSLLVHPDKCSHKYAHDVRRKHARPPGVAASTPRTSAAPLHLRH